MAEKITVTVTEEQAQKRTDVILSEAVGSLSRTRIKELIESGLITCRDGKLKASTKPKAGWVIELTVPDAEEADIVPEEMPLDILYEDGDLLIINKPKGLTVHPAPGHESGTLVNGIMAYLGDSLSGIGGEKRPGIVHRIDKDTTGSLVICKNDMAHRGVAEQLKVHSVNRVYLGIVKGNFRDESGTVSGAIGRDPRERKRMAVTEKGGKDAVTHYRILEQFRGYSYAEFRLETGRTHQIRVHMASIGHPLLGDGVYGRPDSPFRTEGQTLHAATIGLIHPRTGKYLEVTAPLPEYFLNILRVLRTNYQL